jgi:hypothetical protein
VCFFFFFQTFIF